jgi:titin
MSLLSQLRQWRQRISESPDRGDTLVEVLVTVVIVSMAVVALLGGLLTSASASATHRSQTTLTGVINSFADSARSAIQTSAGAAFSTSCSASFPYTVVGAPYPRSGPPGTQVAVLGTGFTASGGTYAGANLTRINTANPVSIPSQPLANSSSGTFGAVAGFTIPSGATGLPAGTYTVEPFDGSHEAASKFTVTPALGAMSPAGGNVSVPVSGFDAGATITGVSVGGQPAAIVSAPPLSSAGVGTVTFTIPNGLQNVQPVTITDGTVTSPTVQLNVSTRTAPASPVVATSPLTSVQFRATINYLSTAQPPVWSPGSSGCPNMNPNVQQLAFKLKDVQPGAGADAGQSIVVSNFSPLAIPSGPAALTATPGNGQVSLSWTAPGYTGTSAVQSYNIYRSLVAGSQGSLINSVSAATTTYIDTGLTNGNQYYYQVTAVNSSGESAASNQAAADTFPGAPTGLQATAGTSQIQLSWTAPIDGNVPTTGYNVYRATSSAGPFNMINPGPIGTTSYSDNTAAAGTLYYYQVTAVNAGGEGPASNQASAEIITAPDAPTGLTATPGPGKGQISLNWTAPANNGGSPITGYNIYRSTVAGTQGAQVATVAAGTTTYPDSSGLANGTKYYYEVTAVNVAGEGTPSAQASATTFNIPGAPTGVTATAGNGGNKHTITVNWTAPAGNGGSAITTYTIYRSTVAGTQGTAIQTVPVGTTSYKDPGPLTQGTKYYYEVTATNVVGEGPVSNQASATSN